MPVLHHCWDWAQRQEMFLALYDAHFRYCHVDVRRGCGHDRFSDRDLPSRHGHPTAAGYAQRALLQDYMCVEAYHRAERVSRRQDLDRRFNRYFEHFAICSFEYGRLCQHMNGPCYLPFPEPGEDMAVFAFRCEIVEIFEGAHSRFWDLPAFHHAYLAPPPQLPVPQLVPVLNPCLPPVVAAPIIAVEPVVAEPPVAPELAPESPVRADCQREDCVSDAGNDRGCVNSLPVPGFRAFQREVRCGTVAIAADSPASPLGSEYESEGAAPSLLDANDFCDSPESLYSSESSSEDCEGLPDLTPADFEMVQMDNDDSNLSLPELRELMFDID